MRVSWFGVQVRVQCVILQDDCGVQEGDWWVSKAHLHASIPLSWGMLV